MASGARRNVLPLLGMREAEAVEKHGLRGASHASRKGRSTCETGDRRRVARSMDTTWARGATRHEADRNLEGSTVIADGDVAGSWHKNPRGLIVKLMLEAKGVTHDASRVQDVWARGQYNHIGDLIAF